MRSKVTAAAMALALVMSACGDDDDGEGATPTSGASSSSSVAGGSSTTATSAAPQDEGCTAERKGGEVTVIPSSVINPLDPITALGASRGYHELMAIYDTLVYRDVESGEFVPQLAESLTPNADSSVWTMKLRSGVKYGNGDPLVANDVKFNVERMAASTRVAAGMAQRIASMQVPDDRTIVFTLKAPWTNLPYYFAHGGGLVANPKLVTERGEGFGTNATGAGAGPYEVESFRPDEEIVLKAKADYWGGPVCIDTIRFRANPQARATYDSFKTGEIDAFLITEQRVIAEAKEEMDPEHGIDWIYSGFGMHLNVGRGNDPLMADVRLRKAVAAAMDLDVLNTRVWDGKGLPTNGLTQSDQLIYSGVDGPPYDPDEARRLVAEVKAETGWDGSVGLTCTNSAEQVELSIAIKGLLDAVGFNVAAENLPPAEQATKALTEGNYQISCGTWVTFDEAPERGLGQFVTGSPQNRTGFGNPELDAVIAKLDTAPIPAGTREVMGEIQEVWNKYVPAVSVNASEWYIGWSDAIHGIKPSIASVVLWDDAWIEQ